MLLVEQGHPLDPGGARRTIEMVRADERPVRGADHRGAALGAGASVRPKSSGQKRYVDAIRDNVITFGVGPAGTGKSWLAVAMAVQALQAKEVERIILTRPAVEAGERLGFLPGDLMAKVDPYLRPLYDALYDMVEPEGAQQLLERGTVEVAPLALHARSGAAGRPQGPDALGVAADRRARGRRPRRRLDGRPTLVLGVFPQGRREVFRVRTQDGAATLACAEHLWFVTTPDDRRHGKAGRVLQTQEMVGRLRRHHQHRFELPLVSQPVRVRAAAGPHGSVRARPAARRRLPHHEDHTVLHDSGSGAGRRAGAALRRGSSPVRKSEIDYVLRRMVQREGRSPTR